MVLIYLHFMKWKEFALKLLSVWCVKMSHLSSFAHNLFTLNRISKLLFESNLIVNISYQRRALVDYLDYFSVDSLQCNKMPLATLHLSIAHVYRFVVVIPFLWLTRHNTIVQWLFSDKFIRADEMATHQKNDIFYVVAINQFKSRSISIFEINFRMEKC